MAGSTQARRKRGRPEVGERVAVRLPADLLGRVDVQAAARGESRAAAIRRLVADALDRPHPDWVGRLEALKEEPETRGETEEV